MKRSILGFSTFAFAVGTAAAFASGCSSSSGGGTRANGGAGGQGASATGSKCVAGPPGANCEDAYVCGQAHCKAEWDTCTTGSGACVPLFECSKGCPCDDNFQKCSSRCAQTNQSIECGLCLSKYSTCLTANCKSEVDACSASNVNPGSGGKPPVAGGGGAGNVVIGPGGSGPGGISGVCDTCEFANDGVCDVPDYCAPGSDCTDCGIVGAGGTGAGGTTGGCDSCQFANDGVCDEPDYCTPGTDCTDCGIVGTGGTGAGGAAGGAGGNVGGCDSCQFANDGVCDEPDYCTPGTDCTDCASPPSTGGVPGAGGVSGTGGTVSTGVIPNRLVGKWYVAVSAVQSIQYAFSDRGSYSYIGLGSAMGTFTVVGAPADCTLGCSGQLTLQPSFGPVEIYTFTIQCNGGNDTLDLTDSGNLTLEYFRPAGSDPGFCG